MGLRGRSEKTKPTPDGSRKRLLEVTNEAHEEPLPRNRRRLAAVAGAQAADLPSKKAAPVEYVRVCSQFGAGFFYIPGSDTCLKVSGRVRADYIWGEAFSRGSNVTTTRARGYLALDSYTATDWGPVRATTRVFVTRDSGRPASSNTAGTTDANVTLDWAYIQFAGITAGRVAVSFFEFAPFGGVSYLGGGANGRGSDYGAINALAYTASFGGGFSATLAPRGRHRASRPSVGCLRHLPDERRLHHADG